MEALEARLAARLEAVEARLALLEAGGSFLVRAAGDEAGSASKEEEEGEDAQKADAGVAAWIPDEWGKDTPQTNDGIELAAVLIPAPAPETVLTGEDDAFEDIDLSHSVAPSMWECVILLGLPGVGCANSACIAFAFAMNLVTQTIMIVCLMRSASAPWSSDDLRGFWNWRVSIGQSWEHADQDTWTSMTSMLCNKAPMALYQKEQNALSVIEQYNEVWSTPLGQFTTGGTLVFLVLVVWVATTANEQYELYMFHLALEQLPKTGNTALQQAVGDRVVISSISTLRFRCMHGVHLLRALVALLVMVCGIMILAYTTKISDMILNAVSLGFIFDLDELFFSQFLPMRVQLLTQRLEPLALKSDQKLSTPNKLLFIFLVACGFFYAFVSQQAVPLMEQVRTVLCGGEQDVVVGMSAATGIVMAYPTTPYDPVRAPYVGRRFPLSIPDYSTASELTVRELVNSSSAASFAGGAFLVAPTRARFEKRLAASLADEQARTHRCDDWNLSSRLASPYLARIRDLALRQTYMNRSSDLDCLGNFHRSSTEPLKCFRDLRHRHGSACADFADLCQGESFVVLRFVCPVTCGCNSPRSGLLFSGPAAGCPHEWCRATPEYQEALNDGGGCIDMTTDAMRSSVEWQSLLDQMHKNLEGGLDSDSQAVLRAHLERVNATGCAALSPASTFCDPTPHRRASLHAFCPASCGCAELDDALRDGLCPRDCARNATGSRSVTALAVAPHV